MDPRYRAELCFYAFRLAPQSGKAGLEDSLVGLTGDSDRCRLDGTVSDIAVMK